MINIEPPLIHVSETVSTNQLIRMISNETPLASGSIVLADFQTAGRGISGSSWESEAGKNLTFSVIFFPVDVPAGRPFLISEMVSLSVKYTLDKYIPDVTVKWPNDIYCEDRKITGILIENTLFQKKITQSIIGIGINVNQTVFKSDAPNPVSMAQITGIELDRMAVLNDFRRVFNEQNERLNNFAVGKTVFDWHVFEEQSERLNNRHFDAIHNDYLDALYRKNGFHLYHDKQGVFEAVIRDIEPAGHLLLERADGTVSCYDFKEVSFLS